MAGDHHRARGPARCYGLLTSSPPRSETKRRTSSATIVQDEANLLTTSLEFLIVELREFVTDRIGQECERKLSRSRSAVAPFEPRRAVIAEVEAERKIARRHFVGLVSVSVSANQTESPCPQSGVAWMLMRLKAKRNLPRRNANNRL